ncbi:MAG: efflux RND transporter permease subunit [Planctomycetota bacterium]|jgi:HAE1 family hydrophobic/amphiphilic exporter-1
MTGPLAGAARRPVAVLMVVAAVVVFGAVSYNRLDLALLPDLNYPTLTVRTEFPGAGPRDVDKRVTEVLEKRLATTGGLASMTSVSRSGFSDITLEFRWDADMTVIRSDLDGKIAAATLPDEAKRPLVLPYDPNLDPIMRIAVSSKGVGEKDLALARQLAEEEVEKELKKLKGVAAAKIRGGREREIAVHLNEAALLRTGIRLQDVVTTLSGANRNEAAGLINEGPIEYVVRSVNELRTPEEIEDLVVARPGNVAVRVRDIGRVEETYKEREMAAYLDGKEAVLVEIYKKADANLVGVAREVRERLFGGTVEKKQQSGRRGRRGHRRRGGGGGIVQQRSLSQTLADWVSLKVLTDQSRFIEGAINEVRDTAFLGGLLAILVLYMFLRNALSTFVAGAVIAICVMATFAPMFLAGVSLNIMSLGGLALGIGMLVDNAIVVLESAARKRQAGLGPLEAAVAGVKDVAGAITASTVTSVCVFFPIVFVEEAGVAGQVFRDLALTVVFSIIVSLLVALFVIPMVLATVPRLLESGRTVQKRVARFGLAGRLFGARYPLAWSKLRRRNVLGKLWAALWLVVAAPVVLLGRGILALVRLGINLLALALFAVGRVMRVLLTPFAAGWARAYAALERAYLPFLRGCLHQRGVVVLLALGALGYAGWRATTLSPDLLPESLTGEFDVKIAFAPGTPLEKTAARLRSVERHVRALDEVDWVATTVGVEQDADRAADEGEHTAHLTVHLRADRKDQTTERSVRHRVDRIIRGVPDVQPPEFLSSSLFRFAIPLRLVFFGGGEGDLTRLTRAAEQTAMGIRGLEGVESVRVSLGRGAREVRLAFDRDALQRFDVTAEDVTQRVRAKIQGRVPTSLVEGSLRTDIRVRIREEDRSSLRDLLDLDVAAPASERSLPLRMVLTGNPVVAEGPGEIHRVGGRHAAIVTAAYEGLDLGAVSDEAAAIATPIAENMGVDVDVAGRSREAATSTRALSIAMLLAIFLVYAVMAAQFESLWQPVLIMAALPLAAVGSIVLLDLLDLPLSVVVLLGAIMLVGIAVNNAIVLVDCINRRRPEAPSVREAILIAAGERLRPILMTTATTILGLLPLTGLLAGLPGADSLPLGLGGGEAAELRAPMAITVIGGLITSTLLTLVLVPVLYDLVAGRKARA